MLIFLLIERDAHAMKMQHGQGNVSNGGSSKQKCTCDGLFKKYLLHL